jgi:hypothetical protein
VQSIITFDEHFSVKINRAVNNEGQNLAAFVPCGFPAVSTSYGYKMAVKTTRKDVPGDLGQFASIKCDDKKFTLLKQ